MKILIATSTIPKSEENFKELCSILRDVAKEYSLEVIKGINWVPGPGCCNLAIEVIGSDENSEKFANSITIALMPSKWCTTKDELPEIDTWIK